LRADWLAGQSEFSQPGGLVNLSGGRSQCQVKVPWDELKGTSCCLIDLLTGAVYERKGDEMVDPGIYIDLEAWGFHFLKF
jgi:hypothetical protein